MGILLSHGIIKQYNRMILWLDNHGADYSDVERPIYALFECIQEK